MLCTCFCLYVYVCNVMSCNVCTIWVFPKIMVPPNHPFVYRVFHFFHHPFLGTPIFGNNHLHTVSKLPPICTQVDRAKSLVADGPYPLGTTPSCYCPCSEFWHQTKTHRIHGAGIFIYMYHKNQPNLGKYKYAIHGSYGKWLKEIPWCFVLPNDPVRFLCKSLFRKMPWSLSGLTFWVSVKICSLFGRVGNISGNKKHQKAQGAPTVVLTWAQKIRNSSPRCKEPSWGP